MDDSDFVEESLKSTRELNSEGKVISKPMIKSDYLLPGADENKCFACNKDLKHLDELRKSLHINHCLDQQEVCNKYEKKKEEWNKVIDCPICGEPLEPGPFRAAHAKRCGKKHHVNPSSLLLLLDTQTKVAEAKKRNGTAHTKLREPKLETKKRFNRLNEEPTSLFDEQMKLVTALSASMCSNGSELYAETQEVSEKPSKMKFKKKERPRSFSFVELEPRACKCEVIERMQENFLKIFKTRDEENLRTVLKKNIQDTEDAMRNAGVCVRKFNSLKQLADDLANFAENNNDVIVFSRENETFLACRFIIAARAPALLQHLSSDGSLKLKEYSGTAVRSYLNFLTSASIIWTENERDEVYSMAVKYGPKSLASLCKSEKLEASSIKEKEVHQSGIHLESNYGDVQNASSLEKIDEIEGGQDCLDAKLRVPNDNKGETEDADSDDPSIVFVEEIERNKKDGDAAKDMHISLKEIPKNLTGSSPPKFPSNRDDESSKRSSDLFHCSLSQWKKLSLNEESQFLDEKVAEHANLNNSFLLKDKVDSDVPVHCPSRSACASPDLDIMDHLNESMESLLQKISPIKPLPSRDEAFSSLAACCSRQSLTDILSGNLISEKLVSPNSLDKNFEETRKSLIKTKSNSEFSVTSKKSPTLLSPFDELSVSHKNVSSSPEKKRTQAAFTHLTSTPKTPKSRLAQRLEELDSDIKILKTKDITPMPVYDLMDDKELKAELAKFGVRPMGKKRAVALLKRIYLETHPVLDSTPLPKKSRKFLSNDSQLRANENVKSCGDEECDAGKALNVSLDENDIIEESYIDIEQSVILPKDLDGMQSVLLNWLRREENSSLHNHLLGLNVIPFEEFVDRLSHADSTVSQIPKKALMEILDRLHVTFQMPMDAWDRKRKRRKK